MLCRKYELIPIKIDFLKASLKLLNGHEFCDNGTNGFLIVTESVTRKKPLVLKYLFIYLFIFIFIFFIYF